MKTKPFIKVCESVVLRRSVVVLCGPKEKIKRLFFDPEMFRQYELPERVRRANWRKIERAGDEVGVWTGDVLGLTLKDGGDVFIVLPEWDSRVFVHEAYHAAQAVLRIIGTQGEELGAFLVEWLFEELCWKEKRG